MENFSAPQPGMNHEVKGPLRHHVDPQDEESFLESENLYETFHSLDKMYSPKGSAIDMDDFEDTYGSASILRDKERIREKKANVLDGDATLFGKFAENILGNADKLKLFGEHADTSTSFSSTYDDYFNGADVVVEINNEGSFDEDGNDIDIPKISRFSVDVTTAQSYHKQNKVDRSVRDFGKGRLSTVKYFDSEYENTGKQPGLPNVPHAVLSVDSSSIIDFLQKAQPYVKKNGKEITDKTLYMRKMKGFAYQYRRSLLQNFSEQIELFLQVSEKKNIFTAEEMNPISSELEGIRKELDIDPQDLKTLSHTLNTISFQKIFQLVQKLKPQEDGPHFEEKQRFYKSLEDLAATPLSIELAYKKKPPH
jgi:hypothetical protein